MIELKQSYLINAPPHAVGVALMDTDTLRIVIPNCTTLRQISEGVFWGMINVGLLKYRFDLDATIKVEPTASGFNIAGTVRAGKAVAGEIDANLVMSPEAEFTRVRATTILRPKRNHGRITMMAGKALAAKLVDMFFSRLNVIFREKSRMAGHS